MKFALTALASVALPTLALTLPYQDPTSAQLALKSKDLAERYNDIKPRLANLGIDNFLDIGTGLSNALSLQANGEIATLDRLATLKANGYGDLAGRLEYSANLGLTSGERGLEALKLMASGGGLSDIENLKKAAHVGQLAKDIGMKSLGALPTSDSIPISTIEAYRANGKFKLANALESTRRGLIEGDKAMKLMRDIAYKKRKEAQAQEEYVAAIEANRIRVQGPHPPPLPTPPPVPVAPVVQQAPAAPSATPYAGHPNNQGYPYVAGYPYNW